ncbi:BTAD domain-containing putative transcriptional regulator [Dactylosporangium sp. NPDC005555]|uniref:ATP-binding protein n=1 Tax=Dactylosporangium sp. NPDC005555 TaxID=3154889 RepID=UPI0033A5883F
MTDQRLTIHTLGRADLALDGQPLTGLASAKAAALLIYLAVTGAGHTRSALAGLLWSDLPEATARANLRLALTKLRRVVPGHLAVTRRTVAFADGAPVWVDAAAVLDPALSAADAVRLCGGQFLHGFDVPGAALFDDWVAARRAALHADMLIVLDRAARWGRDRGDPAAGIDAARRILELDRLHEEAHRVLMRFLAAGGQRGAALAQYETCRYLLDEDLGVPPSPATTALRDEIAAAAEPAFEPAADDRPRPLTSLVGREGELARLRELLGDPACRLVTLVGPGGVGKTRLALEAGGAVFVSFAGIDGAGDAADLVVADLARAFGVPLTVPRDPLDLLVAHLADRRVLVVLDNLEHLPGAAAPLAGLLRRVPGLQLLATSRRPLGLGVEWLVEVPGLPYPPQGAPGDGYAAVRLFQERARPLRPGVEADVDGAARICRLVGGLPLAIELAARWVRAAAPGAIADRLEHGLELLSTTAPDVAPRHRSIRSVLDASVRLLTDEERRALRRLSVQHRFDLAAASAVAGAGLPLLAGLVDQSLITATPDGRYTMHELLRQYLAERLAEDPAEEAETRRRHATHHAALDSPDAANLRAATDWFIGAAAPAELDAHLRRLWTLHRRTGAFKEFQVVVGAALRRTDVPDLCRARWHRLLGEAHQQLGDAVAARRELEQALAVLGSPVPRSGAGWAWMVAVELARRPFGGLAARARRELFRERAASCFAINEVYWVLDQHRRMLPVALRAVNDVERDGDPDLTARTRAGLGMIAGSAGLHRLARRHLAAAVAAAGRTSDPLTACWVGIVGGLHWTGVADWAAVDAAAARVLTRRPAVPLHRWADEVRLIAGVAQHLTGRRAEALASAAAGTAAGRDRQDPVVQLWGLLVLLEATLSADPVDPVDPVDPALPGWVAEALPLLPAASRIDAARLHTAHARMHLAAGRPASAWQAARTADRLIGPRPAPVQYGLEALSGIAEVCQTLLETGAAGAASADGAAVAGASVGGASVAAASVGGASVAAASVGGASVAAASVAVDEVRAVEAAAVRRLRRYARIYPMARPRYGIVLGRHLALRGRARAAARAWTAAARAATRLGMPADAARAAALLQARR